MRRLLISLYLDENVHVLVADLVRARGFEAATALECGQLRASDPEQLAFAVGQKKTLLTHNRRHFEQLCSQYRAEGLKHHGVIIAGQQRPYETVERLMPILSRLTAEEVEDLLLYV